MKANTLPALVLSAFLAVFWSATSLAHVHMQRSEPADKASLSKAPTKVDLWFSGKVAGEWSKIEIKNRNGDRVDSGEVSNDGDPKHLSIHLKPLMTGTYDVKLNVISGDGHRVKGSFSFNIK